MKKSILMFGLVALAAVNVFSGELLQWQDNSLSYLYGDTFKVNPEEQHTLTVEHASGWSMGDLFFFTDFTQFNGDEDFFNGEWTYYGEITPRFSSAKIFDIEYNNPVVKDILLATTYEFGEGDVENYLAGIGFDLNVPGFDFFQLNFYRRWEQTGNNPDAFQMTPVWKMSVPVGKSQVVFDGYMDWVFGASNNNLSFCPQLKLDIGPFVGMEQNKLFAGVEFGYWENKYGIPGEDQKTVSGLVKYHF